LLGFLIRVLGDAGDDSCHLMFAVITELPTSSSRFNSKSMIWLEADRPTYERYRRETSMLIPLPKEHASLRRSTKEFEPRHLTSDGRSDGCAADWTISHKEEDMRMMYRRACLGWSNLLVL